MSLRIGHLQLYPRAKEPRCVAINNSKSGADACILFIPRYTMSSPYLPETIPVHTNSLLVYNSSLINVKFEFSKGEGLFRGILVVPHDPGSRCVILIY